MTCSYLFGRRFAMAMTSLMLLLLLLQPQGSDAQGTGSCSTCVSGKVEYRINAVRQSWEDHRLTAKDMGCELASIKSAEEQVKASEAIQEVRYLYIDQKWEPNRGVAYIGAKLNASDLTDPRVEHYTYNWVDGSAPFEISRSIKRSTAYTNFGSQESMKDFVALRLGYDDPGEWLDWSGSGNNVALYKCCARPKTCAGTKKYRFSPFETGWGDHKAKAEELGCVLASIKSPEEQAAAEAELASYIGFPYQFTVGSYQISSGFNNAFIYIGAEVITDLSDFDAGNYTFEWTDGSGQFQYTRGSSSTTSYTNFHTGDPNGTLFGFWREGVLALSMDERGSVGIPRGKWVDTVSYGGPALYQCCDSPEALAYAECTVA